LSADKRFKENYYRITHKTPKKTPEEKALARIAEAKETGQSRLDLSELDLKTIPKEITELVWLKEIDIRWNKELKNISALSGLSQLTHLDLTGTHVSDLSALSGLSQLTYLKLMVTQVRDLSALSGLSQLTYLDLNGTQISDLSALSGLSQLTELYLSHTQVSDLSPLLPLIKKGIEIKNYDSGICDGIYIECCPLSTPPREVIEQGH